jgi:hypothetical protein
MDITKQIADAIEDKGYKVVYIAYVPDDELVEAPGRKGWNVKVEEIGYIYGSKGQEVLENINRLVDRE